MGRSKRARAAMARAALLAPAAQSMFLKSRRWKARASCSRVTRAQTAPNQVSAAALQASVATFAPVFLRNSAFKLKRVTARTAARVEIFDSWATGVPPLLFHRLHLATSR